MISRQLANIVADVDLRARNRASNDELKQALLAACDAVLSDTMHVLPGDLWRQRLILETVRILDAEPAA